MMRRHTAVVAFCVVGLSAVQAVAGSAPREVVDAAAFGFSTNALPSENTKALQKALDGGNRKVTVSAPGCYRLDGTLYVDDNTDLCCAEGVLFRKAASYSHMILNRGALTGATNVNISIVGLSVTDSGINVSPDPSSSLQGLHGLVTFYRVRNVRLSKFSSPEFGRHQYCVQAVAFDGLTVEDFVIRGGKDGIHLNSGRNFVIRNGRLRTLDDGIAVNAGEWPGYTAEMGSITDGLVENVVDEPGGECNFARVITGGWTDWHPGMKLQRADIFAHGGYTYIVYPAPLGRNETALMTPPTHRKGLWKSPEGLNIICLQPDLWRDASITNVVFRNCRLEGRRGFYCEWEVNEWARLIHPDLPADRYPKADIRMENVSKAGGGPLVHGSSSARIDFVNCHTKDGVLVRMRHDKSVPHPPVREISVDGRPPQRFVGAATVTESSEPEPNAVFGVLSDVHLVPADARSVERF